MNYSAHITSIQYLMDLKSSIGQFCEETQQSLQLINIEIQRSQEWLNQKFDYWRKQVEYRKEEVICLQEALYNCQSKKKHDCGGIEKKLDEAHRALREAVEEVEKVRHWSKIIQQAITDYKKQAYRLGQELQGDISKAGIFLESKIRELKRYLDVNLISGRFVSTASTSTKTPRTVQKNQPQKKISLNKRLPSPGEALDRQLKNNTNTILKEKGVQNIPVKYLVQHINGERSHVKGKGDFHKVSYEDMVEGFHKLNSVVKPKVLKGASGDDFSQMDALQGLDYEHGYRRIYDAFYGESAIHVNRIGENCYDIDNGYHRIFVARDMGLESIPVKVTERVSKEGQ